MDVALQLMEMVRTGEWEIDSAGRIWRMKKRSGNRWRGGTDTGPCTRVRAEWRQRQGYLVVGAMFNGQKVRTGAHRLVWVYLNGQIPDGFTINHINGKKDDNRPANLELATYSEQRAHALTALNVNRNRPRGEKNPKAQITAAQVIEIRRLRAAGTMVLVLAEKFGMKPRAISAICCRRTWKHI